MAGCRAGRWGWIVLLLAGCGGMLPPPPPPRMRTAPAAPAPVADDKVTPKLNLPRGPNAAPEHFKVKFETTKGDVVVDVHRHWAPNAADRFYQLVKEGYYDGNKFFRVATNPHIVQFGLNGDPKVTAKYLNDGIPDEPRTQSNTRGTLVFAKADAPNTRTTQLFINTGDNSRGLDSQGFAPFGRVIEGLEEAVDKFNREYNDESGQAPNQGTIMQHGNTYLDERFPNLDFIIKATVVGDAKAAAKEEPAETDSKPDESKDAPAEPIDDAPKDEAPKDDAAKPDEAKSEGQ